MATQADIDEVDRQVRENTEKLEVLAREALDPSKSLTPLTNQLEREIGDFVELIKRDDLGEGSGFACLAAAIELFADFSEVEVAVIEGMRGAEYTGAPTAARPARAAPRRGMRI